MGKTSKDVYRILDGEGKPQGVYSRSYHDEYDFDSVSCALSANCHGVHKDKSKYKIARYKVTYELIDDDCNPMTEEESALYSERDRLRIDLAKEEEGLSLAEVIFGQNPNRDRMTEIERKILNG